MTNMKSLIQQQAPRVSLSLCYPDIEMISGTGLAWTMSDADFARSFTPAVRRCPVGNQN